MYKIRGVPHTLFSNTIAYTQGIYIEFIYTSDTLFVSNRIEPPTSAHLARHNPLAQSE